MKGSFLWAAVFFAGTLPLLGETPPRKALPRPALLVEALDRGIAQAASSLERFGETAVPYLLEGFSSKEPGVRLARARVLAKVAGASSTEALGKILEREPDPRVRLFLVHALGRRDAPGWREAIAARVRALAPHLGDPDPLVRKETVAVLSAMDEITAARALAAEVRRRSSPSRRRALKGLVSMDSAWAVLPSLFDVVRRELPGLFPLYLSSLGNRYSREALPGVIAFLGSGDPSLRGAAYTAFWGMDSWLFDRKDHPRRLALFLRAWKAHPSNLDLALGAAYTAALDARGSSDPASLSAALEKLVPPTPAGAASPFDRARVLLFQGEERFLAGEGGAAQALFRRAWGACLAARARRPAAGSDDVSGLVSSWLAWRTRVDPPPVEEQIRAVRMRREAYGGPEEENVRNLLRLAGRIAFAAGTAAFLSGREREGAAWIPLAVECIGELEDRWDSDVLGGFRGQDALLQGQGGVLDLLVRGLGRNGKWNLAERGFLFLLRRTSRLRPDLFLPPPGSKDWSPGEGEKAFSRLGLRFAFFLEEAGKREEELRLCRDAVERLEGSGLPANRELRMRFLFRLASIYSDLRKPNESERCLMECLRYYQARKAEIEQHPEFFRNPRAALKWVDGVLAQVHVSLAVNANVLRKDTKAAGYHCRRAFELDGSDFNRVFYACYLARAGKKERAERLAEAVEEGPSLYYNLACTWALLGEKDRALKLLERDFAENYLTARARNLHREWALKDRDLASLREDPRFRALMKKEKE